MSRVVDFNRDHCGEHRADGTGDWSCDFPKQQLRKLISMDVEKDAVATKFFRNFRILPSSTGLETTVYGILRQQLRQQLR